MKVVIKISKIWLPLFALTLSQGVSGQVFEEIETGETCSYFGEQVPEKVTTFASDRESL